MRANKAICGVIPRPCPCHDLAQEHSLLCVWTLISIAPRYCIIGELKLHMPCNIALEYMDHPTSSHVRHAVLCASTVWGLLFASSCNSQTPIGLARLDSVRLQPRHQSWIVCLDMSYHHQQVSSNRAEFVNSCHSPSLSYPFYHCRLPLCIPTVLVKLSKPR